MLCTTTCCVVLRRVLDPGGICACRAMSQAQSAGDVWWRLRLVADTPAETARQHETSPGPVYGPLPHGQLRTHQLNPSEAWAVAMEGRWWGVDLREGTGKLICLKLLLKEDKRRAVANFFVPIAVRLDAMMALVIPSVRRLRSATGLSLSPLHCRSSYIVISRFPTRTQDVFWSGLIDLTIHRWLC